MKKLRFFDINIAEYARQLTIIESKLFGRINAEELLSIGLNKAAAEEASEPARNIKAFLLHDSQLSDWIIRLTLNQTTAKKKVAVINHFVGIADVGFLLHLSMN